MREANSKIAIIGFIKKMRRVAYNDYHNML